MSTASLTAIAFKSFRYFSKSHLAIATGVAAATAVIVGALVVGDSVRTSLRNLVVDRLGNVECLMHTRVLFDAERLDDLNAQSDGSLSAADLVPAILFESTTVESRDFGLTRASQVQLLGVSDAFWNSVPLDEAPKLEPDQVALNQTLASELGVEIGDEVTVLISDPSGIPSDNPLGRRDDKTISLPRQEVVAILPDQTIGGISFKLNQTAPRNLFASLETVQDILDSEHKLNACLMLSNSPAQNLSELRAKGQSACDTLNLNIQPTLEDFGLSLTRHTRTFPDAERRETSDDDRQVVFDYFQLTASQLVIDEETSKSVDETLRERGFETSQLITYLANSITKIQPADSDLNNFPRYRQSRDGREFRIAAETFRLVPPRSQVSKSVELSREVTYSIVVGVDGPLQNVLQSKYMGKDPGLWLHEPFCWINEWLAKEIDAAQGDWLEISYYAPETVDGDRVEQTQRMMIAGIVPLTEPVTGYQRRRPAKYDQLPTVFNDPDLTPSVPGITDQDSILDWDLPFKLEKEIPDADDKYWEDHRLTPKILLPHTFAENFFRSRFGENTGFRIPLPTGEDPAAFEQSLREAIEVALLSTREQKGFVFTPIRAQQLQSASGTTPFDALFLSLSFFVIVAALLLVYLLFKLGLQQRTSELGILQAQGFTASRIRRLLLSEFTIVAFLGSCVGVLLGLGYARLIIAGLESWWIGAISTQFLTYSPKGISLLIGALCGFLSSMLAIYLGLNRAAKVAPLSNLRGVNQEQSNRTRFGKKVYLTLAAVTAVAALGLAGAAFGQTGMAKAGTFFGSGMLLLVACMFAVRQFIEYAPKSKSSAEATDPVGSLSELAWRAIGRNPSRSLLSLSLLSVATFLIASMGVFQLSPTERGYGGFNLIGQSSQPIYDNIGSGSVRSDRLGAQASELRGALIVPMRARLGEDASCNNLFQVNQPTVLGVPPRMGELHDFSSDSIPFDWAATGNPSNPWKAIDSRSRGTENDPIPVILDQNTAMWSLKQGAAVHAKIELELDHRKIYFKTVGLLSNSVLQGKLLISERNFQAIFPELSGYSFFMVNSGPDNDAASVAESLESGWGTEGLDVQYSADILRQFLGVQNTYISAFQSLGALGLLLGTFGLIAVQVRSVLERRREFALMRAVGFSSNRLAKILSLETAILLIGGMLIGVLCAAVALVPFVIEVGPQLSLISPLLMLLGVLVVGSLAAVLAIRAANRQPVLDGLRSE